MRDRDKQAVYDAEDFVFAGTLFDELVTDANIQELADELFGSDWWVKNKIPVPELRLRRLEAKTSMASAYLPSSGRPPEIKFTYEQINPWTLAHEASHIAQYHLCAYPHTPVEGHGIEFRLTYLTVAEILCGRQASVDLAKSFAERVPVNKVVTSAVWAVPANPTPESEGIFPRWRLRKQLEEMKRIQPDTLSIRINGAIAL